MKEIQLTIRVKYLQKNHKIFQYFIHRKAKNYKYLFDDRFEIYDKFEKILLANSLAKISDEIVFSQRHGQEDRVVIEYLNHNGRFELPKNFYLTVIGVVPDSANCDYCEFMQRDNGSYYCLKKEATTKYIKNCKLFNQKKGMIKT